MGRISLLDCTLRDGGNALEAITKEGIDDAVFTNDNIQNLIKELKNSYIDIVEVGSIQSTNDDRRCFAQYQTIEELSATIGEHQNSQMYAGIYRTPDENLDNIPLYRDGLCQAVRVVLRYSELDKSLLFCKGLAEKGYRVFIQPMVTMRYSDEELSKVISAANEMGAYAVYFVDSYGSMVFRDVDRIFEKYSLELDRTIRIGFHAHNNTNMALTNAVHFLEKDTDRQLIVDACVLGMGLGSGNLQTELIARYLNDSCKCHFSMEHILNACEEMNDLFERGLWGYNFKRMIPALFGVAYKYSLDFFDNYRLSASEVFALMEDMPDELKYRYTKEYAKEWISKNEERIHNREIIRR